MNLADCVRAVIAGRAAARAGEPVTACPYDPDGSTAVERAQARLWLRGYDRENPANIDYSE
ncbi:Rmf/CrpP fold protein [Actinomadura chokoriensis]|uniref:Rmf/CrpP fold protein n=1 Tax=Actinomadura chokoriensis TaxID=454156 RepID=UPI0031F76363